MSHSLLTRLVLAISVVLILCGGLASAQTFDIGKALAPTFSDIALLPTRLTYYNLHDDSARATYTCCKPSQEVEIAKALAANAAFLERFPNTDYSDDTCMHNARVNSVRKNFRCMVEALEMLITKFPDSDLADDAAWRVAQAYMSDKDHDAAIEVLNILVTRYPNSGWADDALFSLSTELKAVGNEPEAVRALRDLAYKYPDSDYCAGALNALAASYQAEEDYASAMRASQDLLRRYPCADCADEAQMRIAEALRLQGNIPQAMYAYTDLVDKFYGSGLTNQAMREYNTLLTNLRKTGGRINGNLYQVTEQDPGKDAQDLFDLAMHHQNYREYAAAIDDYRQFANKFPGSDNYDDALFNIGYCYQQMNILFEDINKAKGPEDLFKVKDEYRAATGANSIPGGKLGAIKSATDAFGVVVDKLYGSPLRDDALYEMAKSFEDSAKPDDEAATYQELIINFAGSDKEFEALWRMMKWYANPSNWEAASASYPRLAKAFPRIFPPLLVNNKDAFYTLMGGYSRHVNFAWFESFDHHIPYDFTINDLEYDAAFYVGAMLIDVGKPVEGMQRLRPLLQMPTNDYCAPAIWLTAQAQQKLGNRDAAAGLYQRLATEFNWSGLADDAEMALKSLDQPDGSVSAAVALVKDKYGKDVSNFDCYPGSQVIVFAPHVVSARMREYNMPNVWENAAALMADWTGVTLEGKPIICVDQAGGTRDNFIQVAAAGIADPPQWSLGLEPMAACYVGAACHGKLGGVEPAFSSGLARFAAASLQYDLVTETRDAIGSAAAVALPQEEVIRTRESSLAALEEYVRLQKKLGDVTPEVACGMLFSLLDTKGYSKNKLVDREPYRDLFAALKKGDAGGAKCLPTILGDCLGGGLDQILDKWNLADGQRVSQQ